MARNNRGIRAAIYARVSTDGQATENQMQALRESAALRGWDVVAVHVDQGVSGSKGREARPEFDRLLRGATQRGFDVVMAWSVDRLGRSLQDLVSFLGDLQGAGVDLYLHQQGVDTTTPSGRAMFQMLGVFAEFERSLIQERVRAGLARARAQGKTLGRPRVALEVEGRIRAAKARGLGVRKIALTESVGIGTVYRVLRSDGAGEDAV